MPVEHILIEAKRKYKRDWEERNREKRNAYQKAYNAEHSAVKKVREIDFYIRHATERSENI